MTVDTTASPNKPGNKNNNASPAQSASTSSNQASFQPSPSNPNVIKKNRNEVIRTIQEITKFDEFTINEAIEACQDNEGRYSMDQVLNILMDEKYSAEQNNQDQQSKPKLNRQTGNDPSSNNYDDSSKYLSKGPASTGQNNDRSSNEYHANIYGASNNLDEDDDFDYDANSGINLSPSTNTPRSVESSLVRDDGKPSGLKNVGNTCWFNSIIQTFFHLPYFRRLILSFSIDQSEINRLDENSKNVVQFVAELRKLFALMLKSKRKSINPNLTLRCLRSCSKYDVDTFNQEDVSEFATILVNLIEESFDILYKLQQTKLNNNNSNNSNNNNNPNESSSSIQSKINETDSINKNLSSSITNQSLSESLIDHLNILNLRTTDKLIINQQLNTRKNRKNPIVNLLNGDILINRKNNDEDVTSSMIEIFREVNIQMCNARNLHEGLELEWGETSIDKLTTTSSSNLPGSLNNSISNNKMNKSFYEQESWIVKLPSVLFICLNRYKFIKATQSSSKILEPFEFYPYIYLDRYVYTNRELVKNKRKELKSLNNDLKLLEEKLNSIKNYKYNDDISSNSFALDEVIKCAYHFAITDNSLNDVFNKMSPITKPNIETEQETIQVKEEKQKLKIVTDCLKGWIEQIETKIYDLKSDINNIKQKINTFYDEENLKKIKYSLHSVCIHEGNATSGHFWTYIWNNQQKKWFKFNDTEVCESNWDDLYANALGGGNKNMDSEPSLKNQKQDSLNQQQKNNIINSNLNNVSKSGVANDRSAYFLVYTSDDDPNLYQENYDLDADLVKLLNDDQDAFESQLYSFKLKQILRETVENLRKSNALLANTSVPNASNETNQTCIEHAKAFSDSTNEALSSSFDRILPSKSYAVSGPDEALKHSIEIELNKYVESNQQISAKLPEIDLRLNHILIYFNSNNLNRELKTLALYDLFRMQVFTDNNIKLKILQTQAQIKYNEYVLASAQQTTNNLSSPSNPNTSIDGVTSNPNLLKTYEKWLSDYRDFRSIIAAFINAVNFMETQRFEEATQFFCVACEYNERITQNLVHKMKGMDHEFLLSCRRKCLKLWNQNTIRKFTNRSTGGVVSMHPGESHNLANLLNNNQQLSQQELTNLIETMINKFLPCLFRLSGSSTDDKAMIEEIRKDWLSVLDSNLPEIQIFHDFMTKLFEDTYASHYHSLNVNKTNLSTRYKDVVHTIQKIRV